MLPYAVCVSGFGMHFNRYWRISFNYSLTVCDRQNYTSIFYRWLAKIGRTHTQTRCIVSARNWNPLINRKKFIILCGSSIGWLKEIVRRPSALLAAARHQQNRQISLWMVYSIKYCFFTIWFVCSGSLSSSVSPPMTQRDGKRNAVAGARFKVGQCDRKKKWYNNVEGSGGSSAVCVVNQPSIDAVCCSAAAIKRMCVRCSYISHLPQS